MLLISKLWNIIFVSQTKQKRNNIMSKELEEYHIYQIPVEHSRNLSTEIKDQILFFCPFNSLWVSQGKIIEDLKKYYLLTAYLTHQMTNKESFKR